jgi:hypothetical protein
MTLRSQVSTLRSRIWAPNIVIQRTDGGETYEGVTKSFRTGHLERELKMVQLSATRCSCIAILWVSLSEFCRHNPLCCFSTSVYCCCCCCCCCLFRYRLCPVTFGYTLVQRVNEPPDGILLNLVWDYITLKNVQFETFCFRVSTTPQWGK